ncbi:MAG: transporter [Candidatus Nanopelagicales bacterium]|nr:transporter [Candidatus Nanopelagicales bacterium]
MDVVGLLVEEPLILLFAVLAAGSAIGAVRFGSFSFGSAAVLFTGLAASAYDPALVIPRIVGVLGLAIFAYGVGVSSGPQFFHVLRNYRVAVVLVVGVLLVAAAVAVGMGRLLDLSGPTVAGMYAGALTNTPALAAAIDGLGTDEPTVGYSVSYVGGVLGMVAAVALLGVARLPHAQEVAAADAPPPELVHQTIRVTVDDAPMLGTIVEEGHVIFSRTERDGVVRVATDAFQPQPGDCVAVIGPQEAVDGVTARLGRRSTTYLALDRGTLDFRRIAVSSHDVAGRTIADLRLPRRFGATATRVRRGDIDLLATDDLVLQVGDRVRVVAPRERLPEVARLLGDSERATGELDPTGFALGLTLGLLLGVVAIELPGGATVELGLAGGPLIVGLLLGRVQRTGPLIWALPFPAATALNQLGILLFLAYAGTNAGDDLVAAMRTDQGVRILAGGLVVTTVAAFALTMLGPLLAGIAGPRLAGVIAGFQTQPAVLSFANERTGADPRVNLGYALAYPVAMIVKVLVAPVIGRL